MWFNTLTDLLRGIKSWSQLSWLGNSCRVYHVSWNVILVVENRQITAGYSLYLCRFRHQQTVKAAALSLYLRFATLFSPSKEMRLEQVFPVATASVYHVINFQMDLIMAKLLGSDLRAFGMKTIKKHYSKKLKRATVIFKRPLINAVDVMERITLRTCSNIVSSWASQRSGNKTQIKMFKKRANIGLFCWCKIIKEKIFFSSCYCKSDVIGATILLEVYFAKLTDQIKT